MKTRDFQDKSKQTYPPIPLISGFPPCPLLTVIATFEDTLLDEIMASSCALFSIIWFPGSKLLCTM